ncbi:carbohydrate ABC transporter permease [Actinopolymorpha singaporensis]|nr:carbohydrate ABC transporter permease [Actinopolymorpha singaporensis]
MTGRAPSTGAPPRPAQGMRPGGGQRVRQRRFSRRDRLWAVIMSVILVPIVLVWVYPFIWTVSSSLKSSSEIFGSLSPFSTVLRIGNYAQAWRDAQMGRYFFNTVFVTGFSILIAVLTAALMGYVLGRYRFAGKKVVIAVLALAVFLPEGYTIIPVYDLIDRLHLTDSLWGVTLAEAGGVNIVAVLLFAGYFAQLPAELEEAARIDGAGFLRTFTSVYLPLARPVTATAVIMQFLHSWNDFLLPLVLTLTRPELRTLSVGIYALRGQYLSDWGVMTAGATIALAPIVVVFLLLQRHFVESIAGAVKG